jgi:hypothetical protein
MLDAFRESLGMRKYRRKNVTLTGKTVKERMEEVVTQNGGDKEAAAEQVIAEVQRGDFGHTSPQGKGAAKHAIRATVDDKKISTVPAAFTTAEEPKVHNTQPNPDAGKFDVEDLIYRPGVYVVTITPELAEKLLERNENNRTPKQKAIAAYKNAMLQGRWELTNQGIGFDRNGVLVDGQNRLYACIQAGVPFITTLATGLSPDAKEKIDVGVKRNLADALRMEGFVNAPALAGGISLRAKYEWLVEQGIPWTATQVQFGANARQGGTYMMSHPESLEFLQKRPKLSEKSSGAWVVRKTFPRVPLSVIIAFDSLAGELDESAWAEFRNALITGANLQPQDARLVLRNALTRLPTNRTTNTLVLLGMFIKAWNSWRKGEPREVLSLKESERMPVIV